MKISSSSLFIIAAVVAIGVFHLFKFKHRDHQQAIPRTEVIEATAAHGPVDTPLQAPGRSVPCKKGTSTKAPTDAAGFGAIRFSYRPEAAYFSNSGDSASIVMRPGSYITIKDHIYSLESLQFERIAPSTQNYLALIHHQRDGELLVIRAPLQIGPANNPVIDALWRYLPRRNGEHNALDDIHLDINTLLPHDRTYTLPPITEQCGKRGLTLTLIAPVTISMQQALKLNEALALP